ncbi:putative ensconsin-like [Cocos nucifera]|uniref:Putative ensconsin-like n=1 Tax=Cocos nucifera TaxID=13894 RepID=A0A8K0I8Y3_COCNU|nr:putative ensconsin-like [Cocos nucifera]
MPTLEPTTTIPSPTLSEEVTPSAPLQLEEATGKKKKRAIGKKVERRIESSKSGGLDQEQASLDDRKVLQSLMKGSILSHIAAKMLWRGDIERFDESFTTYLELKHYLFAHSEVVGQRWIKASKALEEARVEAKKVRAEVESRRVALKIQSSEVEHLREELRAEHKEMMNFRTTLA